MLCDSYLLAYVQPESACKYLIMLSLSLSQLMTPRTHRTFKFESKIYKGNNINSWLQFYNLVSSVEVLVHTTNAFVQSNAFVH